MRARGMAALVTAVAMATALVPTLPATSAPGEGEPVLRLMATKTEVTAARYGRRAARLDSVLFVGVTGGALDLRVRRPSFADPLALTQVVHSAGGATERTLPAELLDGWRGLDNFFRVKVTDAAGRTAWSELVTFCPNGYYRQRLDDTGPDVPTFPDGCYASPRLLGMTWGVDRSWAVAAPARGLRLPVPDGRYEVEIAIAPTYRDLFGIASEDASVRLAVTVETYEECERCWHPHSRRTVEGAAPEQGVPDMADPDDSLLPDLRTLPSFSIRARNRRNGRSFIDFAATVWVSGSSPIVVEGFRRSDEPVMDAYQYFYENGEPVGRAPAGAFEYDLRDGHQHWHMLQFVRYQLLDADQANAIRSKKESFCLVPTDAVDLSWDYSELTAERADLHTSCGGPEAMWIRETLPVGWGDTYYQGGRYGFEITDVPNGTYFVEVAANPDGLLHEQDATNNVSLREVILRGKAGKREVIVPDPYGIDGDRFGR